MREREKYPRVQLSDYIPGMEFGLRVRERPQEADPKRLSSSAQELVDGRRELALVGGRHDLAPRVGSFFDPPHQSGPNKWRGLRDIRNVLDLGF